MSRPTFFASLIVMQLLSISVSNSLNDQLLVETFKLKQLAPPVDDEVPQIDYKVALYMKIYKLNDLNQPILSGWKTFTLGYINTPACIDYIASKMGIQERVIFTCPANQGISLALANELEINAAQEDLVIDMQLWKFGTGHDTIE